MITFTPLSGAARSSTTTPLAYLLQVDDVRILIDCGSPDWAPEPSPFDPSTSTTEDQPPSWTEYTEALQKFVLV
jgi:cleavage and polyadenylation specificity factor subunit 2